MRTIMECTEPDTTRFMRALSFRRSQVSWMDPNAPGLTCSRFWNSSIITVSGSCAELSMRALNRSPKVSILPGMSMPDSAAALWRSSHRTLSLLRAMNRYTDLVPSAPFSMSVVFPTLRRPRMTVNWLVCTESRAVSLRTSSSLSRP